ncbi:hypothetical protein RE9425_03310 [Prescottella equi]|nr:hypothetical protein RE9425_03310 [Prescottella equi]
MSASRFDNLGPAINWVDLDQDSLEEYLDDLVDPATVLPVGGNVDPARSQSLGGTDEKWDRALSLTGFHFQHSRKKGLSTFTLSGAEDSPRQVQLVVLKDARTVDEVMSSPKLDSFMPACRYGDQPGSWSDCAGCADCDAEMWTVAVGQDIVLDFLSSKRSRIFDLRRTPSTYGAAEFREDQLRVWMLHWCWYRDTIGVAVSGSGLRSGERMSVALCPICGEVSVVPLDGWGRHALHSCGHRDLAQHPKTIRGLVPHWRDADFPSEAARARRIERECI